MPKTDADTTTATTFDAPTVPVAPTEPKIADQLANLNKALDEELQHASDVAAAEKAKLDNLKAHAQIPADIAGIEKAYAKVHALDPKNPAVMAPGDPRDRTTR